MLKISFLYLIICVVFFVASCDSTPPTKQDSSFATDSGTSLDSGVLDGGSSIDPSIDCSSIPKPPFTINKLDGPIAYHDVAFTPDGYIIGASYKEEGLFKAKYNGKPTIFVPNIIDVEGMDFLPNGNLIIVDTDNGRVAQITPSGEVSTLTSNIYAYGLLVGPDGKVYATCEETVMRIDPKTGEKETLVEVNSNLDIDYDGGVNDNNLALRAVNFNLDLSVMYISCISDDGIILAVDMDKNLNPKSKPYVFVTGVKSSSGELGWHDGLGIDICGNLYVPEYDGRSLYRITPDKKITLLIEWWINPDNDGEINGYGHGVKWGLGVGNWKSDAIYLPQPYNNSTVTEVLINVPARKWDWQE